MALKYVCGYTEKEIASAMGVGYATMRKRIQRAKEMMRGYMVDEDEDEEE